MKSYLLLGKLLHLDNCGLATHTILHEVNHKLQGTYVWLNGDPVRLRDIQNSGITYETHDDNLKFIPENVYEDSHEFKLFVPETGVYTCSEWSLIMTKRVKKFYKKSFYPDAYHFNMLTPASDDISFYKLMGLTRQTIYVTGHYLYYLGHRIGEVDGRTISAYPMYYGDIKEAIKRGSFKIQQPFHLSEAY